MDFKGSNPGAVQYGNFINYYQFNSAEERLKLLPKGDFWAKHSEMKDLEEPYVVLDVGCNSGVFTQLLYGFLKKEINKNIKILGIDIDSILIERAKMDNKYIEIINYKTCDIMCDNQFVKVKEFLKQHNKKKFDAVFCLSITMWIHLNNGDKGLKVFLEKIAEVSKLIVVEPQPWKCYLTALRRMKKVNEAFPYFSELKWRNDVENEIQNYLEMYLNIKKVYESLPTKWKRKICFYVNS